MAKQLIIVRHAKSDWGDFNLKDFDRPLNARGHRNAPEMATRLVEKSIQPSLIVSSPALRAITTANYFASCWKMESEFIKTESSIYEAPFKNLLKVINGLSDQHDIVAMFGHNPGLTDLLNYLTDEHIANMPTCSVAMITFPFDEWKMVSSGTGSLQLFDYPKSGLD